MANELLRDQEIDFDDRSLMLKCFQYYGREDKKFLSRKEFQCLVFDVFAAKPAKSDTDELFAIFDLNADDKIDEKEFEIVWKKWIKAIRKPTTALLVIDVQNDFIDGALPMRNCPAKHEGADVVPVINKLLDVKFDTVVYSFDFHKEDHISFFDNLEKYKLSGEFEEKRSQIKMYDTVVFEDPPQMKQKLWPKHCIEGSWGVQLHTNLKVAENSVMVNKGYDSKIDSYSAFYDNIRSAQTNLQEELNKRNVTHTFVCGIALDYCVANTSLDSARLGYATSVVKDACRGTDEENIKQMLKEMKDLSCLITSTQEVGDLAKGKTTKFEFALGLAKRAVSNTGC